ncbi:MAG: signal peptidase I [Streptosporangiales bacterium]|nr:signal peptidase I [Streptosporangiales bacterium]
MTDDLETAAPPGGASGRHRSAGSSRRRRTGRDSQPERDKKGAFFRELAVLAGLVLVLTALLRGLVFEAYVIPSGSMENTLQVGDKILVNKLSYRFGDIERGDVVVFDGTGSFTPEVKSDDDANPVVEAAQWVWHLFGGTPANEEDFVKRIVGVGGDKVECRRTTTGFAMFVNGTRLDEDSYLYPDNKPCEQEFKGDRAIVVPKGRLWVMGDHRALSADSREHVDDGHLGTVHEDAVIGRGFAVVWPTRHWRTLPTPGTFEQRQLRGAAVDGLLTESGHGSPAATFAAALVGVGVVRGLRGRWRQDPLLPR